MSSAAALAETVDPAILRAERRLRILEELTDIAMNLARTLERHVLAAADAIDRRAMPQAAEPLPGDAPAPARLEFDPSVALARISRAVRLTIALEARTDEQLRALHSGVAAEVETRCVAERNRETSEAGEAAKRSEDVRGAVERLVRDAAEREAPDEESLTCILEALKERLDDEEAYSAIHRLPLRETVERLCADLELPVLRSSQSEGGSPKSDPSSDMSSDLSAEARRAKGEAQRAKEEGGPLRPHDDPPVHPRE
jgi:hypothetical protein